MQRNSLFQLILTDQPSSTDSPPHIDILLTPTHLLSETEQLL
jgi:hypothetical protein